MSPARAPARAPRRAVDTRVKCVICKFKGPPALMKKFTGGFVHFLCDARERIAWRVEEEQE